ncbi:MAG: HNH endonuclease family protein [Nocardioides sp.]
MRGMARLLLALLLAVLVGGCALSTVTASPPAQQPAPARSQPSRTPSPVGAPVVDAAAVRADLATLAVKGRAPMTGYDRDAFGQAWSDDTEDQWGHNGCDTRNDILRRDLRDVALDPRTHGCAVLTGTLADPYGGTLIHFVRGVATSIAVQVDHVVALGDAWQKGARQWTAQRRQAFANDPRELLAVSGPLNASKGDGDAATWLPPAKAYRCAYVARQVAVKKAYGLWVTAAERDAIARVLASCAR